MQLTQEDWIGLCVVLRPRQHSIGYMGDGMYRSKDPIKVLKEKATKENPENKIHICIQIQNSSTDTKNGTHSVDSLLSGAGDMALAVASTVSTPGCGGGAVGDGVGSGGTVG